MKLLTRHWQRICAKSLLPVLLSLSGASHAGLIVKDGVLDTEILGGQLLVAETGVVSATFLGSDAGYFNFLYLENDSAYGPGPIFNKYTPLGTTANLGSFTAGTELIFRLLVTNTGNQFYSGEAGRNPDTLAHAKAITTLEGDDYVTRVGFEDLWGGGDEDYNDFEFKLSNVIDPPGTGQVPAPPMLPLLGLGFGALWLIRRRAARA